VKALLNNNEQQINTRFSRKVQSYHLID